MTKNTKTTSNTVASQASKILTNPSSSATAKSLAASALSQTNKGNQTGSKMEDVAAKVLTSPKYSDSTKKMAGSVLSQSNKKR